MLSVRSATPDDLDLIIHFTRELAEYEKMLDEVTIEPERLRNELFGPQPWAFVLIAEWDGKPAGFAVNYRSFSTFVGHHNIYIEDLFVSPEFRGKQIGYALVKRTAEVALEEGCKRIDWQVLTWNAPSIDFYDKLGAFNREGWYNYRLEGDALKALAAA